MCISDKTEICHFVHIHIHIIIIITRPGANATKYNYQWDNLPLRQCMTSTVCACWHINAIIIRCYTYIAGLKNSY